MKLLILTISVLCAWTVCASAVVDEYMGATIDDASIEIPIITRCIFLIIVILFS